MKREEKMISITLPKTAEAKEGIKKGEGRGGSPPHLPFPRRRERGGSNRIGEDVCCKVAERF